jgi:hypothetical protein
VPTAHERVLDRYKVSLPLCYKATSKRGPVQGFGQTRMMSSQDIIFAPGHGLEPGMNPGIVVGWPSSLDDYQLQLVLQVTITGTQNGEAKASILSYYFRTAGTAQAEQRANSAGMVGPIDRLGAGVRQRR